MVYKVLTQEKTLRQVDSKREQSVAKIRESNLHKHAWFMFGKKNPLNLKGSL
jgi:transcriptional regulator of met regulon